MAKQDAFDDIVERSMPPDEDGAERARLKIRRRLAGRRLDKYLRARFPRLSRTVIQRLIKQGAVTVNAAPTKASYEPDAGDIVELLIPPPEPVELIPEAMALRILYEDPYLLAIDKQAGIICHPAKGSQTGTLANGLAYYAETLSRGGDRFRPGIVHRLDKNTTGVMVVAKTDEAHWRLALQFERRSVTKTYVGVVEGQLQLDADVVEAAIAAHPRVRDRYLVPGARMRSSLRKEAVTRYEVVRRFARQSLVRLYPKTGRTHQLRVHMSYIGHPFVGDSFYGGHDVSERSLLGRGSDEPVMGRQALHAWKIKFVHPISERPLEIEAPLAADLQRLIHLLEEAERT
jgi:23S rRNA pseudouridine1911/1915/1917 synthase